MTRWAVALAGLALWTNVGMNAWADDAVPSYQYDIHVPQSSLSCDQAADQLAQRFEQATGIRPDSAMCRGTVRLGSDHRHYTLYSLRLSYSAKIQPTLYSAFYAVSDEFGKPTDSVGMYDTYRDCQRQLAARTELFQSQTGLLAVAATCQPGSYDFRPSFVLRIDGFGTPAKRLRSQELRLMGSASPAFLGRIDQMLTGLGATLVKHLENRIIYYAPDTLALSHDYLATFHKQGQCEAQLATARTIYAKLGSEAAEVGCLSLGGLSDAIYLEAVRDGNYFLRGDNGTTYSRYYSFDECMGDVGSANAREGYAGGICHPTDLNGNQYELELFSGL